MMMKSKKTNKKLALLVGMALSFSVAYSVPASDIALAATTNISIGGSTGNFEITGAGDTYEDLDGAALVSTLNDILGTATEDNNITLTISSSDNEVWGALEGSALNLGEYTQLVMKDTTNGTFTLDGAEGATVAIGADATAVPTVTGTLSNFTVDTNNAVSADISGVKADIITVKGTGGVTFGAGQLVGLVLDGSAEATVTGSNFVDGANRSITLRDGAVLTVNGGNDLEVGKIIVTGSTASITGSGSETIKSDVNLELGTTELTVNGANLSMVTGDGVKTDITGTGSVTVTGGSLTAGAINVGNSADVSASGGIVADSITAQNVNVGTGALSVGSVTASGTVTAGSVTATGDVDINTISDATTVEGANVKITTAVAGGSDTTITAKNGGKLELTGGVTDMQNVKLSGGTVVIGNGDLDLTASGSSVTANSLDVAGKLNVDSGVSEIDGSLCGGSLTSLKAESITGAANGATINLGSTGTVELTGSSITFGSGSDELGCITAGTVKLTGSNLDLSAPNVINASTLEVGGNLTVTGDVTSVTTGTLKNLTVKGELTESGSGTFAIDLGEDGTVDLSGSSTTLGASTLTSITADTVKLGADTTVDSDVRVTATNLISKGNLEVGDAANFHVQNVATTDSGDFSITDDDANVNLGNLSVAGEFSNAAGSTVKATNATLNTVANGSKLEAGTLTLTGNAPAAALGNFADGELNVDKIVVTGVDAGGDMAAIQAAAATATGNENIQVVNSQAAEEAYNAATDKIRKVNEAAAADKNLALAVKNAAEVANADPFRTKLPTADELAKLSSNKDVVIGGTTKSTDAALEEYRAALQDIVDSVEATGTTDPYKLAAAKDAREKLANISSSASGQAAKLTAAVQQAGKTAAAPAVTSARAATAITTVLTNNVVNRTAEIRGFASAVDEGRPEPDKMWFQYKHTQMDVDGGDVYSKSTINTNNFQLGYDTQIGTNDYLGAYIGTTTGNADFNGPARSGRIDIDNSFDFGVYGTHMLPNDQYIDYMVHTGKFDSEYDSSKWGTTDTGAMVGYGAKIAQGDRLTLNPYIQLAYDKISVDSYTTRAGNVIKSDDSNNWTAKLGMNLIDASGLYGGVAYSRGLSGSYNAYINGVAMPTSDYNANVLYLSLGYRASMAKNAVLDLSMEKTFMDYKGWTAAGKVNFYF